MADILADPSVVAATEDVDFALDETLQTADAANEEFDFDLGGVEVNEDAHLEEQAGDGGEAVALTGVEVAADVDEIGYEEEGDETGPGEPGKDVTGESTRQEGIDSPEHSHDGDEIGYADVDFNVDLHDEGHSVAQLDEHAVPDQHQPDEANDDIDFGFDETGDNAEEEDHGQMGHDEHGQDDTSHLNDEGEGREEREVDEAEEEEEDEDEEANQNRAEAGQDDSDGSGQDYGEDDDIDEDEDSPSSSQNSGFERLRSLHPAANSDIMVTWGDQVCPLFKTPGVEDPDSFYLEDHKVLDYPLFRFLQAIRGNISSWVQASDEIYIKVEGLGLEFGETTTEALLGQVTFHNLLALYNTLVNNENLGAEKSLHIILGTRPNCLLRLKDLVGGASSGKGLSAFQSGHSGVDDSSDDSGDAEAESNNSSPDDEGDDGAEGYENEGGFDVDMAESLDDDSDASESALQAETGGGTNLETPTADEDDAAGSVVEEVDFIEYTNDDEDGDEEGAQGEMGTANAAFDLTTPQADLGDELVATNDGSDLLEQIATDAENLEQQDDLELLEDLNGAGDILNQTQDEQEGARLEPANGFELVEENQQGENDDDFLDLDGDINNDAIQTEALETSNDTLADELDASLGTSATATLDHDEIDYEDNRTEPQDGITLDAVTDEIDWDEEIKTADPIEEATTPNAAGKRTREVDESGAGLLDDDQPDLKRHRTDALSE